MSTIHFLLRPDPLNSGQVGLPPPQGTTTHHTEVQP